MLVLRRRVTERLVIGDDVEIEILEIGNGQVKIGITAPREVPVLRSEVRVTTHQNRSSASLSDAHLRDLTDRSEAANNFRKQP